jgi:hypothetical protein
MGSLTRHKQACTVVAVVHGLEYTILRRALSTKRAKGSEGTKTSDLLHLETLFSNRKSSIKRN